jgi:hypothetical protein
MDPTEAGVTEAKPALYPDQAGMRISKIPHTSMKL